VARLAIDEDSVWLATGGSDSRVRLWELATFNCIHSLKGSQGVIRYDPECDLLWLELMNVLYVLVCSNSDLTQMKYSVLEMIAPSEVGL
jgi:WD40 repeat protein